MKEILVGRQKNAVGTLCHVKQRLIVGTFPCGPTNVNDFMALVVQQGSRRLGKILVEEELHEANAS
jgi:hypothetical protein